MDGKKGLNMKFLLLMFGIIPLTVAALVLTIISIVLSSSNLEKQTKQSLIVAATGLKEYYEWDIAESGEPAYEHEYVDSLKSEDIDLTVFMGNTRFSTSILNADGTRNEGTQAGAGIWESVSTGSSYYSNDVKISGKDFYVYYLPINDSNNKVVGMAFAGKPCADVSKAKSSLVLISIIAALVLVAIAVVVIMVISKSVIVPLQKTTDALETISNGDFTAANNANSTLSETKSLIDSSKKLQRNIDNMLREIRGCSEQLVSQAEDVASLSGQSTSSCDQVSNAVEELADGANSMAENVQNINAQVIDMGNLISNVANNVNNLSSSSSQMKNANDDAYRYITNMEQSSQNTFSAVQGIKERILRTNESVNQISQAIQMITEIASQTNLLALNASIEAARAGEQGRGFAVVAEEIGKLAAQSNDSANDIRSIVDAIVLESQQSVQYSEQVETAIDKEREILVETKDRFDVLNNEINSSVEDIREISSQIENLENVKGVIVENISDLSAISEENAASTQEVSASMESIAGSIQTISGNGTDINKIAKQLNEAVNKFRF